MTEQTPPPRVVRLQGLACGTVLSMDLDPHYAIGKIYDEHIKRLRVLGNVDEYALVAVDPERAEDRVWYVSKADDYGTSYQEIIRYLSPREQAIQKAYEKIREMLRADFGEPL